MPSWPYGARLAHAPRRHAFAARLAIAASFVGVAVVSAEARAADFEVTGDTAFQAYQVSDPWGDVVIERRRFMQTIGLAAYNLQGAYEPGKPDYRVVMKLRLDSDFGIDGNLPASQAGGETTYHTPAGDGVRFIPGLQEAPLDIMYGYVEGRNLAGGLLGFRLGRQYMTDMLGWWSFDGGLVRLTTPYYMQLEIYGGLEQRGGLPLSTGQFEQQGVWRGSHTGFGTADGQPSVQDYPSYQYAEPAPAFGFAIDTNGPSFIHGRFSYRRVYNTGESITQQFPDPAPNQATAAAGYKTVDGTRLSSEKFGYAADASKNDLGGVKGGFSYDLYTQAVASWYGGLEAYLGKHVTVGADVDYFLPTFDADSIWNWFTHSPITTAQLRTSIKFTKRFDLSASGGFRIWTTDGDPATFGAGECKAIGQNANCYQTSYVDPTASFGGRVAAFDRNDTNRALDQTLDVLGNFAARYRFATGQLNFRSMLETGDRGRRVGGDVDGEKKLDDGRFTLGARTSLYDWDDPLRPDRSATSFAYVLAGGFTPVSAADFRVEWEHDMNRLVGQRYRVVGLMNLKVLK